MSIRFMSKAKKRKRQILVAACVLGAICLVATADGWNRMNDVVYANEQTQTISESYVKLIGESIQRKNSYGVTYYQRLRSYPEIFIQGNPQASQGINSYYQNYILSQSDQDSEKFIQEYMTNPDSYSESFAYEYSEDLQCARADNLAVSFVVVGSIYTGGVHPSVWQTTANFDCQIGTYLSLADILTENSLELSSSKGLTVSPSELLAAKIANKIYEDSELYSELFDTSQIPTIAKELVREGTRWYFAQDGIVFYFQPYAIAPYSSGIVQLTLPYTSLHGIVKDEYLTPGAQFAQTTVFY